MYPTISEYISSILDAEDNLANRKSLRPVLDSSGNPVMSSGNYAVVFKMVDTDNGENYAMKCFLRDQEGREESYLRICEELKYVESSYLVNVEYLPGELFVDSKNSKEEEFPVLLMEWVEGRTLGEYVSANYSNHNKMCQLSWRFSRMASWLLAQDFAHGDLKPDNIIVKENGSLVLVDYDGMYVPSMKGSPAREMGSPNFRHPSRTMKDFDGHIDDFALAVLGLTLKVLSLSPDSFPAIKDNDYSLFGERNYLNLSKATGCEYVKPELNDPDVQKLWGIFLIALSEKQLSSVSFRLPVLELPPSATLRPSSETFSVKGVSFKMIYVAGGTFTMGATPEQGSDAWDREKPAHSVTLDGYSIGETEVTQALWTAVMGSNPSLHKGDGYPVECVSWLDCQDFIKKMNSLTGRTFRLPTEAEWEFAARGGTLSRGYKYAGSDNLSDVAWYDGNSGNHTNAVKTKFPNELGLYDMSGNVWEWCNDWCSGYTASSQTNPMGPSSGSRRVYRGGSYVGSARSCRVSYRGCHGPSDSGYHLGLRLAL